jgi:PST family polysaccharide transporter
LSRYGRPVLLSLFLREVGFSGTVAVVGRLLGTADLGRFRAAQRIALQTNTAVVYGGAYVLFPAFARIWEDEHRFRHLILRAIRNLSLIVFPLSLLFLPLGQPFADIFLGRGWQGVGKVLMAMSGVGIALAFDSISSEAFKATGTTGLLPRMHALTATVPVFLMLALHNFGVTAMGLALSLGMIVVAAYATWSLSRMTHLPLPTILVEALPALVGSLVMAVALYVVDRQVVHAGEHAHTVGALLFALDLLLAGVFYFSALLVVSRRSVLELLQLAKLVVGRRGPSAPSTAA